MVPFTFGPPLDPCMLLTGLGVKYPLFDNASICQLSILDMLVVGEVDVFNEGIRAENFHKVISVRTKASKRVNGKMTLKELCKRLAFAQPHHHLAIKPLTARQRECNLGRIWEEWLTFDHKYPQQF